MPFQYRPRQNRYVGSIADLMGRGRDAEAQALITAANAQAQAAQASGQAWGGAVQGIGNTIAAIPGQLQAQQDRARVVEQQDQADQARALRADIFNPAHTIGPVMPDGTKLSPTTPGAAVEGPGSMAGDWAVASGRELPNRYRTTDANGSDIFDLEQIIATFAAAGLDPPDMSPYVAINQGITARFDQSLQQARGIARGLLGRPSGAWGPGLSTALSLFEDNKLLPARLLSSMRTRLQQIGTLPAAEQEAELGQLLHELTGDTAPETKFVPEGSVGVTPIPGGGFKATTVGPAAQPSLTADQANRLEHRRAVEEGRTTASYNRWLAEEKRLPAEPPRPTEGERNRLEHRRAVEEGRTTASYNRWLTEQRTLPESPDTTPPVPLITDDQGVVDVPASMTGLGLTPAPHEDKLWDRADMTTTGLGSIPVRLLGPVTGAGEQSMANMSAIDIVKEMATRSLAENPRLAVAERRAIRESIDIGTGILESPDKVRIKFRELETVLRRALQRKELIDDIGAILQTIDILGVPAETDWWGRTVQPSPDTAEFDNNGNLIPR